MIWDDLIFVVAVSNPIRSSDPDFILIQGEDEFQATIEYIQK